MTTRGQDSKEPLDIGKVATEENLRSFKPSGIDRIVDGIERLPVHAWIGDPE